MGKLQKIGIVNNIIEPDFVDTRRHHFDHDDAFDGV
jgi:hypothetical protein